MTPPAGWGAFAVVKLGVALTLAVPWWVQWGGVSLKRPGYSLLASLSIVFLAWVFCSVLEVTHGVFTLELTSNGARLELRTPFRRRRWQCRLGQFGLGVIDEVRQAHERANGDWLSERYIRLFFDEREVRFMLGHDERALSRTRFQLGRWLAEVSAVNHTRQ